MNIAKFAMAGSLNTLLAYVVYILLIMGGMKYLHALIVDYIIGIIIGYLINYYWVFTNHGNHGLKFIKYLIIYIGVFFLNGLFLTLMVESGISGPIMSQFIILCIISLLSYLVQKYWIFL